MNKFGYSSDAIADLYRAALYLAKGSKDIGLSFLSKAEKKLGNKLSINSVALMNQSGLDSQKGQKFWAEKILDEYSKFKYKKI